jgi:hypothetical protein
MLDAKRLVIDAVCVLVLAFLMIWAANAIAAVPIVLPPSTAGGHGAAPASPDCNTPTPQSPKETTVAGGLPGLNLADCGDKEKTDAAKKN